MDIKKGISGSVLKYIALVSMLIDHFGVVILYRGLFLNAYYSGNTVLADKYHQIYNVCRILGRIAFPIFAFLLVEGFKYTKSRQKYALRLFVFAILSQAPFYLAFHFSEMNAPRLNVMVTLLIGFLAMWAMDKLDNSVPYSILIAAAALAAAYFSDCDYDVFGVLVILLFYWFRNRRIAASALSLAALVCLSLKEAACIVSMILINVYNNTRGRQIKYLFYVFYPLHLLVLYLIWRYVLA